MLLAPSHILSIPFHSVVLLQTATHVAGWRLIFSSARTSSQRCWCSRKLTRSGWKPTRRCWPAPRAPQGMVAGWQGTHVVIFISEALFDVLIV